MGRPLDDLAPALRHQNVRGTAVEDVRIERREDSTGEVAVFVSLLLSDPPQGAETWPVQDLWDLRQKVDDVISDAAGDLDRPWFVVFEREHPEPPDPDEVSVEVSDSVSTSESVNVKIT